MKTFHLNQFFQSIGDGQIAVGIEDAYVARAYPTITGNCFCCCIGLIQIAYVVGRDAVDENAIKAWVAERVVEYKQLSDVVSCEVIPKNPSGKILRRVLRVTDAQRMAHIGA